MRRFQGRVIGVLAGAALAAGAVSAAPIVTAHALGCSTTVRGSGIPLDPRVSRNDFTATPSLSYDWAAVCGFTPSHATAPDGGAEDSFQISLEQFLPPAFPDANLDLGVTFAACADVNGAIANMPVQVGVNHRGQPVFDGPYPAEDGYKVCTYATLQADTPVDYGVELFDPDGTFTVLDYPSLVTTGGTPTISAPTGVAASSAQVTLYLPDTWTYLVDPPPPPLQGVARNFSETMINGSTSNAFVMTQSGVEAALPTGAACVNVRPAGTTCNGNQMVGPIFGVASLLPISGWAPGTIQCWTIDGLPEPQTCSEAGTGGYQNAVDLGVLPLPPAVQAVRTPCVDPLDSGNGDCATESGATTYFPCQSTNAPGGQDVGDLYAITGADNAPCTTGGQSLQYEYVSQYGRIWPGEPGVPTVSANGGGSFTIGPSFLSDGVSF